MRKKQYQWEVIQLKASPARFLGLVHAADEGAAIEAAIVAFKVRPTDQKRLMVRRH